MIAHGEQLRGPVNGKLDAILELPKICSAAQLRPSQSSYLLPLIQVEVYMLAKAELPHDIAGKIEGGII